MADKFHAQIEISLADANLQAALDANAEKRVAVRKTAFAQMSDYPQRRQRAHAIREDVINHLDEYLDAFLRKVQENGVIVHRAKDAAQAVQLVLDIARSKKARLIAKSKTMVSEEINLNQALEANGLRVVETDLGEFIIQLRGEHPSHIITPAAHLRRSQVGQTFHEKLGVPLTDSIPEMTNVARQTLREVFLTADIGLSGVNFGVVETGTMCVMTNEGNGRMVTTVPRTHIALMGMERLVPTLDDLALMMSLLPRSATGQNMTVYASLIQKPRGAQDSDGPQERHLIVVDNGRDALRSTPLAEILYCIRCGACLNACPVFREIGGHGYVSSSGKGSTYPGPIGSVLSPALFGQNEFGYLARASSLCGACKEACPVDIDLPKLLLRVRAGGVKPETQRAPAQVPGYLKFGLRGFRWIATSPWRFRAAQKLAGFFSRLVSPNSNWLHLPALTGWGYSKDFPRPAARPFSEWMEHRDGESEDQPTERIFNRSLQTQSPPNVPERAAQTISAEGDQTDIFKNALEALSGTFTACWPEELANKIYALLQERGITHVMAWEEEFLPQGLLESLQDRGIGVTHQPDPSAQAGITGALAGAADTATLLLPGGAGRPLTASLLPAVHIAVLREKDIYPDLVPVLNLPEVKMQAASALVSGPSRTADIEMSLTLGVHGPKEVCVFCVCSVADAVAQ